MFIKIQFIYSLFGIVDLLESKNNLSSLFSKFELEMKLHEILSHGLNLSEIENIFIFIAFLRFLTFFIRFNFKFAIYVGFIGVLAAFLWYRHLIRVAGYYSQPLLTVPYVSRFAYECYSSHKFNDLLIRLNEESINPVDIFTVYKDNNERYRIDFISMLFANVPESIKHDTDKFYYFLYRNLGPKVLISLKLIFGEIKNLLPYVLIVRMNKKYCPYLIRWHWTFLLVLNAFENPYINIMLRGWNYLLDVLIPKIEFLKINDPNSLMSVEYTSLLQEKTFLYLFLVLGMLIHISFLIFGVFHALFGQYFYFPFIVENTELHIGPRPKYSFYSSGFNFGEKEMKLATKKSNSFNFKRMIKKFINRIRRKIKKFFF